MLDLFIEYQGTWTHGVEPFNGVNLKKLWIKKATLGSEYYKNAINTYTVRDPLKRRVAKENNLNYLEIWTKDYNKGLDWITSLIKRVLND